MPYFDRYLFIVEDEVGSADPCDSGIIRTRQKLCVQIKNAGIIILPLDRRPLLVDDDERIPTPAPASFQIKTKRAGTLLPQAINTL